MRRKGKGKGKGRRPGRHLTYIIHNMSDADYDEIFFGGKGKGKGRGHKAGRRSTGKGRGRRGNPLGKDGKPLECFVMKDDGTRCGSTMRLARDCPHNKHRTSTGKGGSSSSVHHTNTAPEGGSQQQSVLSEDYEALFDQPTYNSDDSYPNYLIYTDDESDGPPPLVSSSDSGRSCFWSS